MPKSRQRLRAIACRGPASLSLPLHHCSARCCCSSHPWDLPPPPTSHAGQGLTADNFVDLSLPVEQFLRERDGWTVQTCTADKTLAQVLAQLTDGPQCLHRLWVVDADGVASGVVTLTDLLQRFMFDEEGA